MEFVELDDDETPEEQDLLESAIAEDAGLEENLRRSTYKPSTYKRSTYKPTTRRTTTTRRTYRPSTYRSYSYRTYRPTSYYRSPAYYTYISYKGGYRPTYYSSYLIPGSYYSYTGYHRGYGTTHKWCGTNQYLRLSTMASRNNKCFWCPRRRYSVAGSVGTSACKARASYRNIQLDDNEPVEDVELIQNPEDPEDIDQDIVELDEDYGTDEIEPNEEWMKENHAEPPLEGSEWGYTGYSIGALAGLSAIAWAYQRNKK
jgi:hypothetical protein